MILYMALHVECHQVWGPLSEIKFSIGSVMEAARGKITMQYIGVRQLVVVT